MKTNLISKAVVMLAVVMASVMNFSASASNPTQYVKNEEMTGELMTAKTIFKNEAWVPYFKMDVFYANNEVELSYARWNSKSNAYDSSIKKTIYEMNDDNVTLMLASTK